MEHRPLVWFVEGRVARSGFACFISERNLLNRQLAGVQYECVGRLMNGEGDRFLTRESEVGEIRSQANNVPFGSRGFR